MRNRIIVYWLTISLIAFTACMEEKEVILPIPSIGTDNNNPNAGGSFVIQNFKYITDVPYKQNIDETKQTVMSGPTLYEQINVEEGYAWESITGLAYSSMTRSSLPLGVVVDYHKLRLNQISKIIMKANYKIDLIASIGANGSAIYEEGVTPGLISSQNFIQKVKNASTNGVYPLIAYSYFNEVYSEEHILASSGVNVNGSLSKEAIALKTSYAKTENIQEINNQHVMVFHAGIIDFVINADIDQQIFLENYSSDQTPAILSSIAFGKVFMFTASWNDGRKESEIANAIGFGLQYAGIAGLESTINNASAANSTLSDVTIKVMILGGSPSSGAMVLIEPTIESIATFLRDCVGRPEYATPIAFAWTAPDGTQLSFSTAGQYAQLSKIGEIITSTMKIDPYNKSPITGSYTFEVLSTKKIPVTLKLSAGGDCYWVSPNLVVFETDPAWFFDTDLNLWRLAKTAAIDSDCRDMNDGARHYGSFNVNAIAIYDGIAYDSPQIHKWEQWTRKYKLYISW